jgi:SAM-dependent methyltransferase
MSGADLVAAVQAALPVWQATHAAQREAIAPRRRRWAAVMTAALPGFNNCESDELFVRHALLVAVARVVARGVDVSELQGGLDWPLEVAGLMEGLADRLAGFDWDVDEDVLGPLYAGMISAEQRKGAGEHYTPDWLALRVLARVMHAGDRVMDPACGSGTFIFHAVRRALGEPGASMKDVVRRVRGMDLHPVAVVLARANYLLALGRPSGIDVPIRQGDGMVGGGEDVDVLIGNPPWLAYRFMTAGMQATFRAQSELYSLWGGGTVSTHQDLCGLFVVRVIDQLLKNGGRFGFVMPGAVLDRAQFVGFRGGRYGDAVCVDFAGAWDLRRIRPHVFPVAAAVVFGARAQRAGAALTATEVWARDASQGQVVVAEEGARSPYHARFRQGATLVPRVLALVEREAGCGVRSARSAHEKRPWRDLTGLRGEVEAEYLWPVYLGEHVAPYRSFAPALGVLPWGTAGWVEPTVADCPGLAAWWREGEARWLGHRVSEKLTLRGQFDYQQKLASQFPVSPLRVVYTKSGMHLTAAKVSHARAVVDHTLYWMAARSVDEADYLCALLNSAGVTRRVRPLMAYGKDERHIDKHVWRLPIPLFDPANPVHGALVRAARRAEAEIAGRPVAGGWIAVRREIRGFLASSAVGREIEGLVGELLGGQNG